MSRDATTTFGRLARPTRVSRFDVSPRWAMLERGVTPREPEATAKALGKDAKPGQGVRRAKAASVS